MTTLTLQGVKERKAVAANPAPEPNEAPEVPAPTPELNPRNAAIAEIAKAAAAKADEESEELSQLYDDEANKPKEPTQEEAEPEPEESSEPEPEPEETHAPRTVRVKVNGQEIDVPEDEIIATYQKERSADQKFQEAARMRDEAYALVRQTQPQKQEEPSTKELVEKIQYGSAEEAQSAFEQMQRLTAEKARQAVQEELLGAELRKFASDNADLMQDPVTRGALTALEEHLAASDFQGSPRARWDEAAKQVRERFAQSTPKTQATAVKATPSQTRLERKASIQSVPTASARPPTSPESKPKTTAEIIEAERMRRTKGRNF